MAIQTREDRFANLASITATESGTGVLTYAELLTGISIGAGIGILIDKIAYNFEVGGIGTLIASADALYAGWTTSKVPTSFDYNDRRVIDMIALYSEPTIGTAASAGHPFRMPLFHDFSPPLIIASPRLYLGVQGASLAGPITCRSRMFFRYQPLTDKEYLELAETFVLVG